MINKPYGIISNVSLIDVPWAIIKYVIAYPVHLMHLTPQWYMLLMYKFGLKDSVTITANGRAIIIDSKKRHDDFFNSLGAHPNLPVKINNDYVEFKVANKILKFYFDSEARLGNTLNVIDEVFVDCIYKSLDVKNKVVVDIGGNVGDTAIYFAMNGASKVYAYEAVPRIFRILLKNVKVNDFENKVTAYNKACGSGKSIIIAESEDRAGELFSANNGIRINMISLDKITKKACIKSDGVLKMDCEGCEYDIILKAASKTLRAYSDIMLEYHRGYKNLIKRLRSEGFEVSHTRPLYVRKGDGLSSNLMVGLIWAHQNRK
jgi:FkbM family methyltransferase